MVNDDHFNKLIQESLKEELRFLNAQLPVKQKTLQTLLEEEKPSIKCNDGSLYFFKRKELEYLSGLIGAEYWNRLNLPIIIEINPGENEISIVCRSEVEEKLFTAILGMPVTLKQQRIIIYNLQLAAIRKVLKTTTQYLFSPKILRSSS